MSAVAGAGLVLNGCGVSVSREGRCNPGATECGWDGAFGLLPLSFGAVCSEFAGCEIFRGDEAVVMLTGDRDLVT